MPGRYAARLMRWQPLTPRACPTTVGHFCQQMLDIGSQRPPRGVTYATAPLLARPVSHWFVDPAAPAGTGPAPGARARFAHRSHAARVGKGGPHHPRDHRPADLPGLEMEHDPSAALPSERAGRAPERAPSSAWFRSIDRPYGASRQDHLRPQRFYGKEYRRPEHQL